MIKSHRDIIGLWPSIRRLAIDLNQDYQKVFKWHVRDFIPAPYWHAVIQCAHQRDLPLTYKLLAETCKIDKDKKKPALAD